MRRNRKVQHSVWLGVLLGVAVAGQAGAGHVGARRDSGSQHGGRAQVVALLELSTGQPTVTMDEATRSRLGGALQRSLRGRKVTAELFEVAGDVAKVSPVGHSGSSDSSGRKSHTTSGAFNLVTLRATLRDPFVC